MQKNRALKIILIAMILLIVAVLPFAFSVSYAKWENLNPSLSANVSVEIGGQTTTVTNGVVTSDGQPVDVKEILNDGAPTGAYKAGQFEMRDKTLSLSMYLNGQIAKSTPNVLSGGNSMTISGVFVWLTVEQTETGYILRLLKEDFDPDFEVSVEKPVTIYMKIVTDKITFSLVNVWANE